MIDIHAHILPGVDDGASKMKESVQMLSMAREQGVTDVFATSHYSKQYPNIKSEILRGLCKKVERQANRVKGGKKTSEKEKRKIRIWTGQEIFYSEEVPQLLDEGKLMTLADSDYVLIEFSPTVSYSEISHAVGDLRMSGFDPIIAHAERYQCLRTDNRVADLISQGAYIQLNFRSIGGKWYDSTTRWCRKMLKNHMVHVLGTDMHNTRSRKPDTEAAVHWMRLNLKRSYVKRLMHENARRIIKNKEI